MLSPLQLIKKYNVDEAHAKQVARLALSIFDQTRKLHGLGNKERGYLDAAAILHNLGTAISMKKHHKHSFELIMKNGINGFSDQEVLIIANVARYHRRAFPKKSHKAFSKLSKQHRDVVKKLSAIVRIADALDRSWKKTVNDVKVQSTKSTVIFKILSDHEVSNEIAGCVKKAGLWEKVFGTTTKFIRAT